MTWIHNREFGEFYYALVKGEYTLKECGNCYGGTVFVDTDRGEEISPREYHERMDESCADLETEICDKCCGTGKLVTIDSSELNPFQ